MEVSDIYRGGTDSWIIEGIRMMNTTRRALLSFAPALAVIPTRWATAQQDVTSGGIGLTMANLDSIFEFVEHGQSGPVYRDLATGAEFQVGFNGAPLPENFATDFWIYDGLDPQAASDLLTWLIPDDVIYEHTFAFRQGAGTMESSTTHVLTSGFLAATTGLGGILASYTLTPSQGSETVRAFVITIERPPQ